ncbi:MAG: SDR family NAD(P)-dependent oxidoreductase [Eubacterium sp.]|nr:SDR family NAD(P)-dependent oxidoreductase [Eubacterium sp.]
MGASIAVVGMGCLFPDAMDLSEYWSNLISGKDSITEIPDNYWLISDYYDKDTKKRDKTYSKRAGLVNSIQFDPFEFGIVPNDLESISVEQIFSLVIAKQALIDAGLYGKDAKKFNREKTGVVMAASIGKNAFSLHTRLQIPKYRKILLNSGVSESLTEKVLARMADAEVEWSANSNPGYLPNVVAGRVASRFNLCGTNYTVDAACASGLAALNCAVNELQSGNCDIMLAGGVSLDCTEFSFVSFCKTPAISSSDRIKPFDRDADGMLLGDGVGIVVLKRLKDAIKDKDKIYGVIRGIGSSGDGKGKGIFSPNIEGQKRALQRAYDKTKIDPCSISLIEAHGTGTKVGDSYEISSLNEYFGQFNLKHNIGIGSVKSQIGHTRLAAGIASFIKVLLALDHQVQPGTLHVDNIGDYFKDSCFKVISKTKPWIVDRDNPIRRCGISSFGFGGTNYHCIVEEWNPKKKKPYRLNTIPTGIVLDGESIEDLIEQCGAMIIKLEENPDYVLNELFINNKIKQTHKRIGFVCSTAEEAISKLRTAIELLTNTDNQSGWKQKGILFRQNGLAKTHKVAMFSHTNCDIVMNGYQDLAVNYPELRESVGRADSIKRKGTNTKIAELLYPYEMDSALRDKPDWKTILLANRAVTNGIFKMMKHRGVQCDYFITDDKNEEQLNYFTGKIKERECFKKTLNKDKQLRNNFDSPCKMDELAGVIYQYKKKKIRKKESVKDMLEMLAKKETDIVIYLGNRDSVAEELNKSAIGNGITLVTMNEDCQNSLFSYEYMLLKLRILGIEVKKDPYSLVKKIAPSTGKNLIEVNPIIYRNAKSEQRVKEAIDFVEEKSDQVKNEITNEEKRAITNESKIKTNYKSKKEIVPKEEHKVHLSYAEQLDMQAVNSKGLMKYLTSRNENWKRLNQYINTNLDEKFETVLDRMKQNDDKKTIAFKEYLKEQVAIGNKNTSLASGNISSSEVKLSKTGMRMFQVALKEAKLEKPTFVLKEGLVIVILDEEKLAIGICEELERKGFIPVLVSVMAKSSVTIKYPVFELNEIHEDEIELCFEKITSTCQAPLTGFVFLSSKSGGKICMRQGYDTMKLVFFCAKFFYLFSDKLLEKKERKFFINLVQMDGKLGVTGNENNTVLGGLFGLAKSVASEWSKDTIVKTIDVESCCKKSEIIQFFMEEVFSDNARCLEIGRCQDGKRYYLGLQEHNDVHEAKNVPTEQDIFLVSGGGQGITAKCIIRLAKEYHSKFILMARNELKDDVSWLMNCKTKREVQDLLIKKMKEEKKKLKPNEIAILVKRYYSQVMVRKTIDELKKAGSTVAYYSCDVTNENQVKHVINEVTKDYGAITGFIHGAGILADKFIYKKNEKDYDKVVATKIMGFHTCFSNLEQNKLKYIVMFSSVAAFFGNKGQTDYSMANDTLNKIAYVLKRKYPSCCTVAINWGPWDYGMIDNSLKNALVSRNISVLSVEEGVEIFLQQFKYQQENMQAQKVVFDKMYF